MTKSKTSYCPKNELTEQDLEQMYQILGKYYHNAPFNTFKSDFDNKDGAIVIREKSTGNVVGFSTIVNRKMEIDGKKVFTIFSGDTIIEKEYWGDNALQKVFFLNLVKQWFLHPFTPIYWLLISKGYKTYLLLANNFVDYYPHYKKDYPELEKASEAYCDMLFTGYYDKGRKLLDFGEQYQALKTDVAEITEETCQKFPRIAFFREKNPTWDQGTELPCIGVFSYKVLLFFPLKPVIRFVSSLIPKPVSAKYNAIRAKIKNWKDTNDFGKMETIEEYDG
ncbi:MAG: hypothetical protein GY754_14665 [bacterium]|nr:hypothetical protein [bacterium]